MRNAIIIVGNAPTFFQSGLLRDGASFVPVLGTIAPRSAFDTAPLPAGLSLSAMRSGFVHCASLGGRTGDGRSLSAHPLGTQQVSRQI